MNQGNPQKRNFPCDILQRGITSIELLIASTLISAIFLLAFSSSTSSTRFCKKLSADTQFESRKRELRTFLEDGLRNSRSRYAISGFRLHSNGKITDVYGRPHPVIQGQSMLRPKKHSSALSFLRLSENYSAKILKVPSGHSAKSPYFSHLCFATEVPVETQHRWKKKHSWIAAGLDGYIQLEGRIFRISSKKYPCPSGLLFKGSFALANPLMFARINNPEYQNTSKSLSRQLHILSQNLSTLIPIEESYAIYLDQRETVRRLSLDSVGNQPLAYDIASFRVNDGTSLRRVKKFEVYLELKGKRGIDNKNSIFNLHRLLTPQEDVVDVLF